MPLLSAARQLATCVACSAWSGVRVQEEKPPEKDEKEQPKKEEEKKEEVKKEEENKEEEKKEEAKKDEEEKKEEKKEEEPKKEEPKPGETVVWLLHHIRVTFSLRSVCLFSAIMAKE